MCNVVHVLDENFSVLTNLGFAKMCECVGLTSFTDVFYDARKMRQNEAPTPFINLLH